MCIDIATCVVEFPTAHGQLVVMGQLRRMHENFSSCLYGVDWFTCKGQVERRLLCQRRRKKRATTEVVALHLNPLLDAMFRLVRAGRHVPRERCSRHDRGVSCTAQVLGKARVVV